MASQQSGNNAFRMIVSLQIILARIGGISRCRRYRRHAGDALPVDVISTSTSTPRIKISIAEVRMKLPSYLNPMAYLRNIKRVLSRLSRPAPYNDLPNYDEYWQERHAKGLNPGALHRYQVIAKLLPDSATVLDVGCGDGAFGLYLAKTRPDCKFHGVDISSVAVQYAQSRGLSAQILDPSKSLQEQIDTTFDCVTVMEVLEHIVDAEEVMTTIAALSRGWIYVTIPNAGCIYHRMRLALFGRFPITNIVFHMKEHVRFWTYLDFKQWIARFNLEIIDVIGQSGVGSKVENILARKLPKLFAMQVIYVLKKNDHEYA